MNITNLILALAATAGSSFAKESKKCLSREQAEKFAREILEGFSGHIEKLNSTLTSNVVVYENPFNNGKTTPLSTSLDAFYRIIDATFQNPVNSPFLDLVFRPDFVINNCDSVTVRYTGTGHASGNGDVAAGTPFQISGTDVYFINTATRKAFRLYGAFDLFDYNRLLGLSQH